MYRTCDLTTDSFCNRRREGVSDLAVSGGFSTGEFPVSGETLDGSSHLDGQLRDTYEVLGRWLVRED